MEQKSYHHGNLKDALIEAGIQIVDREGLQSLSLRKAAALCGVSHAAPYNHFRDKEELLGAMQEHISERFAGRLEEALQSHDGQEDVLLLLGCAYLRFFLDNPRYYGFLFGRVGVTVDLDDLDQDNYPPFDIFKTAAQRILKARGVPEEEHLKTVLAMWSVVHGFTGMATMNTVNYSGSWEELLLQILREKVCVL